MTTPTTYPEFPISEFTHLQRIVKELKEVLAREDKRHEMDEHLTPSMRALLEEEIIPVLENELNYDPTDDMGGEPPMTADEMHTAAWNQHRELHS
jgi:hypothetical protein